MPGRLIMDQQGAIGSQDLKKDRNQAQQHALPPKPDFAQKPPAPAVSAPASHAANGTVPNGVPARSQGPPTTNGDVNSAVQASSSSDTPPPLDQSWREGDSNKSMGKLLERISQNCFEELDTTVAKMAEMQMDSQGGQPNGVASQTVDFSEGSLSKKRTFMDFANGQRDRFIKTLVLSDWARNSEEVSTLIDIKGWQDRQEMAQTSAINFIGQTKHDLRNAKIPNPNLDLAMELLATGKAARAPDLGYLKQKKLSAKETLRALRNMNVMLETRLNLHEELPPHFNDFSVANGKVTFRVPGEFEVDLAIADELPSSQFYFINLRFLFSPAGGLSDQLRAELEMRTNDKLATKGLQGCYDFLHNFVLTHKINVLHDQARQIEREKWFGCLSIQKSRRVLTIQYWRGMPGRKNWLEIAVSTGKQQSGRKSRRAPTPHLSTRLFRRGELVQDDPIVIDWQDLSIERILSAVVAKHTSWLLDSARLRLQTMAGHNPKLEIDSETSTSAPEDCFLRTSLPGMQKPLTAKVEPVTGRLSLSPSTPRAADAEARLNKAPDLDVSGALANLLCNTVKDRIDKAAELAGWKPVRALMRSDNFKELFGAVIPASRAYTCGPGWGQQWAVFLTSSLVGGKWWIVRLEDRPNGPNNIPVKAIVTAREISIPKAAGKEVSTSISRAQLLRIEKLAVAEVSFAVLSQQLSALGLQYRIQKTTPLTREDSSAAIEASPILAMIVPCDGLLKHNAGNKSLINSVKFTNHGLDALQTGGNGLAEITHDLRLTVEDGKLKHLREYMTKAKRRDVDIAMNKSGVLDLRLRTRFGEPFLEQAKGRLESCERLDQYLAVLNAARWTPITISFTKVTFAYNQSPEMTASCTFLGADGRLPAKLKLEPLDSNPHQRLRASMEKMFNNISVGNNFYLMCHFLKRTLPVMRYFDKITAPTESGRHSVVIHVRSSVLYTLQYQAPLPTWAFNVEYKEQRAPNGTAISMWKISPEKKRTIQDLRGSELGRALLGLVQDKKVHGWTGLEDGTIVANVGGEVSALEKIDELVRTCSGQDEREAKEDGAAANSTGAQASKQQQKAPNQQKPNAPKSSTPVNTNAKAPANANSAAARANQSKVKKEIIELD